ncbi:MAG: aminoacyl-tRNA hydrolase [Bacilli bacterium]|nr:aminoacyl-tRNA hydrolase [Bacilli bacterium]MDD3304657.1 aminoacyl-tRNA hydrolase [Bacilli bacterium]MDD4053291.1 aminoacyl-tRNA hydrolase [Bacilli bacterium]MDD4411368.1 aminoacyl-tRNA hydrolase [Bacilli bacterium]
MKLIVGLGNPGKEYNNTRHNIGFMVIDALAEKKDVTLDVNKNDALYTQTIIDGEKVILLKPQRYINLSGEVISEFINYYKIDIDDILIINDDLDIPLGSYKLKSHGSSAGHNGLKNIESHLKTAEYKRLKIGISNNKSIDTKNYVLGFFSKNDKKIVDEMLDKASDIALDFIKMDFLSLMNKYNGS